MSVLFVAVFISVTGLGLDVGGCYNNFSGCVQVGVILLLDFILRFVVHTILFLVVLVVVFVYLSVVCCCLFVLVRFPFSLLYCDTCVLVWWKSVCFLCLLDVYRWFVASC